MPGSFADQQSITVALPVADRRTTFAFYADGLGLHHLGDPADDGLPEPLQFAPNDGVRVMFIPTGGFGWVTGNRATAPSDQSECLLGMTLADQRTFSAWSIGQEGPVQRSLWNRPNSRGDSAPCSPIQTAISGRCGRPTPRVRSPTAIEAGQSTQNDDPHAEPAADAFDG